MRVSTQKVMAPMERRVGRRRINAEEATVRLAEGTLARVRATLAEGEPLSAFLRSAVERELERRERG